MTTNGCPQGANDEQILDIDLVGSLQPKSILINGVKYVRADSDNLAAVRELVEQQAEDARLWFSPFWPSEAYLQQELRKLHAAIELTTGFDPAPRWFNRALSEKEIEEVEDALNEKYDVF